MQKFRPEQAKLLKELNFEIKNRKPLAKAMRNSESSRVSNALRLLRKLLKKDNDLKAFATQRGFAELAECSLGLVQAVEQGITPLSKRLAQSIEERLGVSAEWLQNPEAILPIPAVDGTPVTAKSIKQKLQLEIDSNDEEFADWVCKEPRCRVADALGDSVRDAQLEAERLGDYQFVAGILRELNEFQKRKEMSAGSAGDASPPEA